MQVNAQKRSLALRGGPDRQRAIIAAGGQQMTIERPGQRAYYARMRGQALWSIEALTPKAALLLL